MASKSSGGWGGGLRGTVEKITYFFRDLFDDEAGADQRCQECGAACTNQKYLCSQSCAFNFWIRVRNRSGRRLCMLPGCEKECYIERGRQHDFCGRTHKMEYEKQMHEMYGYYSDVKGKRCKLPGCDKLCYVNNYGTVHDFCNKKHAEQYADVKSKRCKLPGCDALCYVNDFGIVHDFCNKKHAEQYKQTTDICLCDHCSSKEKTTINFYEKEQNYYEFTNFFEFAPIKLDGEEWKTTEHYFQAQKFVGTPYKDYIRLHAITPQDAFEYSRRPECLRWQRDNWELVKEDIMLKALLAKFSQHKRLRQLLLSTRNRKLVNHTYNDSFWGDGGDGKGANKLGILLMEIRDLIRQEG